MKRNEETKEKICAFYASDYHFEMISLPYITNSLENQKDVVILTENNLNSTIENLISKMNLKEEKKEKILNLNWGNNDLEKFKIISNASKREKELIIFIKGKENYINNVNKNIDKWLNTAKNSKVINCYDIEEVGDNVNKIMEKYNKILSTTGEKEISKI